MALGHADHVALIRGGVGPGGSWADLGSGWDAFTLALAELLGPEGRIQSVDMDASALDRQRLGMNAGFPRSQVTYTHADFTRPLGLSLLDGVVMANSLHFVEAKVPVLRLVASYLAPGGRLILVEYDADTGNPWVPHPLSFESWRRLAQEGGFVGTTLLDTVPSRFLGRIYSSLSLLRTDAPRS